MTPDDRIATARRELATAQAEIAKLLEQDKSRRRAGLIRRLHEIRQMLDRTYLYSSQAGQDTVIDRLLNGKREGTFIDVGGYDGTTGSNTFFLEQWRGWTGVLVEPVPSQLAKAQAVRRCTCLGLAVAASDGDADFLEVTEGFTQMSGLAQSYDPSLLAQVRQDPRHKEQTLRVQTRTLSRILTDAGIPDPDFISLDIEGGEAAVLAAFPFMLHRVNFWAIENNSGGPEIATIMRDSGYDLIEFCGPDEIYRRRGI